MCKKVNGGASFWSRPSSGLIPLECVQRVTATTPWNGDREVLESGGGQNQARPMNYHVGITICTVFVNFWCWIATSYEYHFRNVSILIARSSCLRLFCKIYVRKFEEKHVFFSSKPASLLTPVFSYNTVNSSPTTEIIMRIMKNTNLLLNYQCIVQVT